MVNKKFFIILLNLILLCSTVNGQIVSSDARAFDADSVRKEYNDRPYFGLYKDNYFIFGPSVGAEPTVRNTNVKFQISFSQRLTRNTLPWNTYLYLFYTQKCFWNILEESMPMTDLNFNPGIGLGKPIFAKDRFIGELKLMLEHESNGRSEENSRSWNKISLGVNIMIDPHCIIHAKGWIPIVDGRHNKDLLDYYGIYQMGMSLRSSNNKFGFSTLFTKRRGWDLNYNITVEASYRIKNTHNQYLFMQFYNGYGEGLLDYNKFHSQLRVGFVIKPRLISDF